MRFGKGCSLGLPFILCYLFLSACSSSSNPQGTINRHPEDIQDMSVVRNAMVPMSDQKKTEQVMKELLELAEKKNYQASRKLFSEQLLSDMRTKAREGNLSEKELASSYFAAMNKVKDLSANDFRVERFDRRIEYQHLNNSTGKQQLAVFQFVEEQTGWKLEKYYISKNWEQG